MSGAEEAERNGRTAPRDVAEIQRLQAELAALLQKFKHERTSHVSTQHEVFRRIIQLVLTKKHTITK